MRISGPGDTTWLILTPSGHLRASAPINQSSLPAGPPASGSFKISREGDAKAALSSKGLQLKDEVVPNSGVNTTGELSFSRSNESPPPPQAILGGAHPETDGKLYLAGIEVAPGVPVRSVAYVDDFAVYEQDGIGETLEFAYANITELGGVGGRTVFRDDIPANYYYIKDHLGSTRMVVDEDMNVVEATAYLAYGSIVDVGPVSPVAGAREKFTGKEFDTEGTANGAPGIRLDYFGKRYYDPSIGVWTSTDPANQFWGLYSYVGNGHNPVSSYDPDGTNAVKRVLSKALRRAWRKYGRAIRNSKLAGTVYKGVRFTKEGFPDFSKVAKKTVKVAGLTGNYAHDAKLANAAAKMDAVPKDMVWHHVEDGATMMLVPKSIHNEIAHTGGAALLRSGIQIGGTLLMNAGEFLDTFDPLGLAEKVYRRMTGVSSPFATPAEIRAARIQAGLDL